MHTTEKNEMQRVIGSMYMGPLVMFSWWQKNHPIKHIPRSTPTMMFIKSLTTRMVFPLQFEIVTTSGMRMLAHAISMEVVHRAKLSVEFVCHGEQGILGFDQHLTDLL